MNFLEFFLQVDKQRHLIVSLVLLTLLIGIRLFILKRKWFLKQASFSLRDVLAIWILKEIVDMLWFWNPEFLDFFADSFWIIVVFYIYFIYREWKKLDNWKFIHYELKLIYKLKNKFSILINRFILYIKIKYKILIFRKKILYYLPNKSMDYLLKKTIFDFIHILNYTFIYSLIWLFNLIILTIKIPFIAFYDAINGIIRMIKYSFDKNINDLKFID